MRRLPSLTAAAVTGVMAFVIGGGVLVAIVVVEGGSDRGEEISSAVPDTDATVPEPIHQPPGAVHGGGGSAPEYVEPVPLVPGDYKPPSASNEAHEKFSTALAAERTSPQFSGVVNGFRMYGWADAKADPSVLQKECVSVQFSEVILMVFTYLPPGTKARSPQYAGVCADGSTAWVTQDFIYGYGTFSVGYELGEKAIGHDAVAERVTSCYDS